MNRRRLLATGTAVATASVSTLAGCLDGLDDENGSDGTGDDPRENESGPSSDDEATSGSRTSTTARTSVEAVAEWLPSPEAIGVDPYDAELVTPARLEPHRDALDPALGQQLDRSLGLLGEDDWSNVDAFGFVDLGYKRGSLMILLGGIEVDRLRRIADADGLDAVGRRHGLERYAGDGEAMAISEGTVLLVIDGDAQDLLDAVVAAANGTGPRYADDHAWVAQFVADLPDADVARLEENAAGVRLMGAENATTKGEAYDVRGSEARVTEIIRFETAADATESAAAAYLDEHRARPDPDEVSIEVAGRQVRIETTIDASDVPGI